jgi:hypothetical protein
MTSIMTRNPTAGVDYRSVSKDSLNRFLGYFSLGLGLAEALAPRAMAKLTGLNRHGLLCAYGLRELLSGLGILSNPRRAGWLWTRVAGDALDLLTLGNSLNEGNAQKRKRALASLFAVAGVTALDMFCASCQSKRRTEG